MMVKGREERNEKKFKKVSERAGGRREERGRG